MNSYFYAPKEDLYHRFKWRENYSEIWLNKFKEFYNFAKSHNIRIIVGISPGLILILIQLTISQKKLKMIYQY